METTTRSGIQVRHHDIIGTRSRIYTAWEPTTPYGEHQTIRRIDGAYYGQVGTKRMDDAELAGMEYGSVARIAAVKKHYDREAGRARAAIFAAYPHLLATDHKVRGCEITTMEGTR